MHNHFTTRSIAILRLPFGSLLVRTVTFACLLIFTLNACSNSEQEQQAAQKTDVLTDGSGTKSATTQTTATQRLPYRVIARTDSKNGDSNHPMIAYILLASEKVSASLTPGQGVSVYQIDLVEPFSWTSGVTVKTKQFGELRLDQGDLYGTAAQLKAIARYIGELKDNGTAPVFVPQNTN